MFSFTVMIHPWPSSSFLLSREKSKSEQCSSHKPFWMCRDGRHESCEHPSCVCARIALHHAPEVRHFAGCKPCPVPRAAYEQVEVWAPTLCPTHGGRGEQTTQGWKSGLCHDAVGFTCWLILLMQLHWVFPCPCIWLTFRKRVGVGMHEKLSVHTVRRIQTLLMIYAVPKEQFGSLAAMQPCVHASPCECRLAVFFSWPWNQAMGAGRKDWVSSLLFWYFPMNPPKSATLQNEGIPDFYFLCPAEGRDRKSWVRLNNGNQSGMEECVKQEDWVYEKLDQAWERKALISVELLSYICARKVSSISWVDRERANRYRAANRAFVSCYSASSTNQVTSPWAKSTKYA